MEHSYEYRSELVPTWHLMINLSHAPCYFGPFSQCWVTDTWHVGRHGGSLIWETLKGLGTNPSEVERKPNFDLWLSRVGFPELAFQSWLSRVGFPVHGYRPTKQHSCKDVKMATPLDFCRGMSRPVNWYRLMLRHVIRHVANMWVWEQAMWARLSLTPFHSVAVRFAIMCSQR